MTSPGILQIDKNSFDLDQTNIYGIYEPQGGYMTWHIEMFLVGEVSYVMFNSLVFDNIFSPSELSNIKYKATSGTDDLYEHTIHINGQDRFMQSVDMTFENWDAISQSIKLSGNGIIAAGDALPEATYQFTAFLKFSEIDIFETSQEETKKFADNHLTGMKDNLEIKFENVESGLHAIIKGQF